MVKKLTEKQWEKLWDQVDYLAQEKIYNLLTRSLPLPGLKLITHGYDYSAEHQKLTGLFLHKDVDYRTILVELEQKYYEEELPSKMYLAEEVALNYYHLFFKNIISDCKDYSGYDDFYFTNLTHD